MLKNNPDLRSFLKSHNYILGRKLGEGGFREAYEVLKSKGTLQKLFVAKVYFQKKKNSVLHRISQSKHLDQREIRILNGINHPNIIQLYDLLEENGHSITIEEHFDAISLEDKVRIQGPIMNQEYLKKIFSQAQEALRYLHINGEMLHRDLKPSNILIGRTTDLVKVADFETAALLSEVEKKMLPTRGGTKYSHPNLINHLLAGYPNSAADIATEFYALGVTLFYALTGKQPFEYELNIVDEGTPLQIGDE
ncbi:MAG: protein kinase, partial [Nanoarchaeota archaeon]